MLRKHKNTDSLILIILAVVVFSLPGAGTCASDPGQMIADSQKFYGNVKDITCFLYLKELIDDKYIEQKNVFVKHRKPLSFYLKYTEGEKKGTEVIYVQGQNSNKLVAHSGGLLKWLTLKLDPTGSIAMKDSRHTVLEAHIGRIIEICDKNYKLAMHLKVGTFEPCEERLIGGRPTDCIKAVFPNDKRFYGGVNYIYFDREYKFPIAVEIHGWKNELLEKYEYTNIKLNLGLSDKDFDPKNPEYEF
ncbi:MAG: DUF1571 domain-containing protein [Syntrophobacteraceae bacterium]